MILTFKLGVTHCMGSESLSTTNTFFKKKTELALFICELPLRLENETASSRIPLTAIFTRVHFAPSVSTILELVRVAGDPHAKKHVLM